MSYHHLILILILALNFSGKPAPVFPTKTVSPRIEKVISPRDENEEFIPWTFSRRLEWEDFLCAPKNNTDAVASTSTSLGIAYQVEDGQLTYSISCNFSKHKSWGLLKTEYILSHEQGHFDITEIFARKLYKALSEYQFNRRTYRKDVNEIYKALVEEKENMQAQYDGESDHSRNKRIQYDWLQKIDEMLDETAPYANYP